MPVIRNETIQIYIMKRLISLHSPHPSPTFSTSSGVISVNSPVCTLSCGMWDLVPWPGIESRPPTLGAWNLSTGLPGQSLSILYIMISRVLLQPAFLITWSYSVNILFAGKSFVWSEHYSNKIFGWGKWRGKVYYSTHDQVSRMRILFLKRDMVFKNIRILFISFV